MTVRLWVGKGTGVRLWQVGDSGSGLPHNGLVGLWDPYRDAYGLSEAARLALQTGTDYSGMGNHLTFGESASASTDDPVNTGMAWQFDGGGFMTAGRPAQLEVAQPWWGFGVYYIATGTYAALVGKHNAHYSSPSAAGFFVRINPNKTCVLFAFSGSGTITDVSTASPLSAGWHWISYGWDGTSLIIDVDQGNTGVVEMSTYTPDVANKLTFGRYAHVEDWYFAGSIALAGFYSRFPSISEQERIKLYVRSLMAERGITLP